MKSSILAILAVSSIFVACTAQVTPIGTEGSDEKKGPGGASSDGGAGCLVVGGPCSSDANCCSGDSCTNGICVAGGGSSSGGTSSGGTSSGSSSGGATDGGAGCLVVGGPCSSDSDCCTGISCTNGICSPPGAEDGGAGCLVVGNPCSSDANCCAGDTCTNGVCTQ